MSRPIIEVCLTPALLDLYPVKNKIVVVIDVLRATSTIGVALDHGANAIIPVGSIEECLKYQDEPDHLLAGERGGHKVEGFKYGNSPFEYMNGVVENKTLVLTTTNGTRSIESSREADCVIAGSFLNLDVLCDYLKQQKKDILLLCAGWKNRVNMEDTLFAGAVLSQLWKRFESDCDSSLGARQLYEHHNGDLMGAMQYASHFRRLSNQGIMEDIEYCLTPNQINVIPVLEDNKLVRLNELAL